ncbi:hypothetical protein BW23_4259 [Burkholderia ubonensis MSMB22]|nr:hypothetical protein BW23_4259 [Burkholderia ubonensis MSMB22]
MPALDHSQIVAGGLEQAHQRRYAHVASRKRFHAGKRRARDAGTLGKLSLGKPCRATRLFQHLSDIRQCCHL